MLKLSLYKLYNLDNGLLLKILLIYAIIIDSINGYTQDIGIDTPIGIIFRGIILLLIIVPVLKHGGGWIKIFFAIIISVYILCIPLWILSGAEFGFAAEITYLFKLIYFFVVVLFFYNNRHLVNINECVKIAFYSGFCIGALNIFCFVSGLGVKSYGENFGFGTKAFYADGNSMGLFMILVLPLMIWFCFRTKKATYFLMTIVATIGTLLIGSRAAIGGVVLSWCVLLPYYSIFKDHFILISRWVKLLTLTIGGTIIGIIIYALVLFITTFDSYTLDKFSLDGIASPREELIEIGQDVYNGRDGITYFIGEGFSGGIASMGDVYGGHTITKKSIEADNYDLLLFFGYGFGGIMIIFHLLFFLLIFVRPYLKNRNSLSLTLFAVGSIWYAASLIAGHGFYNTSLAPLFAIYTVISYKLISGNDIKRDFK